MRKTLFIAVILGIVLFSQPVLANPGISITVDVIDKYTGGADLSAEYNVKVESMTGVEEDVVLTIRPAETSELLSGEQQADISWFDWTFKSFSLAAGAIQEFTLHASLPAGVSAGDYRFVAEGNATDPTMPWMPAEDSDSQEIVVVTEATIPEFPTIALPIISALGIMLLMTRRKGRS
jgi:hypothetical protein